VSAWHALRASAHFALSGAGTLELRDPAAFREDIRSIGSGSIEIISEAGRARVPPAPPGSPRSLTLVGSLADRGRPRLSSVEQAQLDALRPFAARLRLNEYKLLV